MMSNLLLSANGDTEQIPVSPEWDFKFTHHKIESVHRTLAGKQYRYVWGVYYGAKFRIEFVSSAQAAAINNWHSSSSPVRLIDEGVTQLFSGYLVNASTPIDQHVKPFVDQLMGVIELEGNTPYNAIKVPANISC